MQRALRFCTTPGCPHFRAPGKHGKCRDCARASDRARGTAVQRGYDVAWSAYARQWLALHRWCGERADFQSYPDHSLCVQQGTRRRADCVDHIRALKFGGAKLDPANHQSLCSGCNARKAAQLEGAFSQVR